MRKINYRVKNPTRRKVLIIYLILIGLVIGGATFSPVFRSFRNISNILVQSTALGIISSGQTFVILSSGIDLSVGSIMSLTTALVSSTMQNSPLAILGSIGW